MKYTALMLLSTLICASAIAQPLADQYIARYNENESPYPLYMGEQGPDPAWTTAELEIVARNFNAAYGNPLWNASQWAAIRAINPDFELVPYAGNWQTSGIKYIHPTNPNTSYSPQEIEQSQKDQFLHYRYASLAQSIDSTTTTFNVTDTLGTVFASTAPAGATYGTWNGGTFQYVTWIVVEGEFMRIEGVSGNTLTVTRGWDGTSAAAHAAGSAVAVPVYGSDPNPDGSSGFIYRTSPGPLMRYYDILNRLLREYDARGGGIWIDIIEGGLSIKRMDGGLVGNRLWEIDDNTAYSNAEYSIDGNIGINFVQEEFFARRGVYPVIWGNNVLHPSDNSFDRLNLLRATSEKPRPIDGYAQENTIGGYGTGGESGKIFSWKSYGNWLDNVESMMFMGENKYSARPLMLDGGVDNRNFSVESDAFREQTLLYGYATYLMAVIVEPDDSIYTQVGFTPLVGPDGNKQVVLPRFFQWDIGRPTETVHHSNLLNYKVSDTDIFLRSFENGLVLANPSDNASPQTVQLGGTWFDPLSGNLITQLTMPQKTGRLLFNPEIREAKLASTPNATPSSLATEWHVFPDLNYQPEFTDNLTSNEWQVTGPPLQATGKTMQLNFSTSIADSAFFRLQTILTEIIGTNFVDHFDTYPQNAGLNSADVPYWETVIGNDATIGLQDNNPVVDFSAGSNRHIATETAFTASSTSDHSVEISFKTSVNSYGLVLHYTDPNNHIFIYFNTEDDTINFTRILNGTATTTVLGIASEDIINQTWYTLKVTYTATTDEYAIELQHRGGSPEGAATALFTGTHTDATFDSGRVGFGYDFAGSGYADNFKAEMLIGSN